MQALLHSVDGAALNQSWYSRPRHGRSHKPSSCTMFSVSNKVVTWTDTDALSRKRRNGVDGTLRG